jgi:hypothetical protein
VVGQFCLYPLLQVTKHTLTKPVLIVADEASGFFSGKGWTTVKTNTLQVEGCDEAYTPFGLHYTQTERHRQV